MRELFGGLKLGKGKPSKVDSGWRTPLSPRAHAVDRRHLAKESSVGILRSDFLIRAQAPLLKGTRSQIVRFRTRQTGTLPKIGGRWLRTVR